MKVVVAKHAGFCFGVQNAVDVTKKIAKETTNVCTFGKLIHNEIVTNSLAEMGVNSIENIDEIESDSTVIIRSHGTTKDMTISLQNKAKCVVDATCPFVKKIHNIVEKYSEMDYDVIILGQIGHPEVVGINGWCGGQAKIIGSADEAKEVKITKNTCIVAQTTFSVDKYASIIKIFSKQQAKTVEIFDTICYTTYKRQSEAKEISRSCHIMLVLGSASSSNTSKLYSICEQNCKRCYLIQNVADLKKIKTQLTDSIGIVAGASTPPELIMEVKGLMSSHDNDNMTMFQEAVEDIGKNLREGARVTGTVIEANEDGIKLNIGQKKDGFIPCDEVEMDGDYNPSAYESGAQVEVKIIKINDQDTGCIILSKKKIDIIREGDKQVETIRNGEIFELKIEKAIKGGLLSSMGTYSVFIPASQVRESFVKDLGPIVGKTLRVTSIEINDERHRIVASARKVLEEERKAREEMFWSHVQPDVIVSGKVKRITNFGAFVSVDGFDCLAHIVDLSWTHIKSVEEVLKVGETYDFLVTKVDKETGRVSLSYKMLQAHPFDACMEKHPIGSITKGKVVSIVPFGAFVEIEKGIEGLVHVSEAAHTFIKTVSEVVKVGDEVDVKILNADPSQKKITLSIKATKPEEAPASNDDSAKSESKPRKTSSRKPAVEKEDKGWSDETSNNIFAELLQGLDLGDDN